MSSLKKTQKLVIIGLLTAMSLVLYLFEVPVVPGVEHLKIDFGDVPALAGAVLFGPWVGVSVEFLKNVLEFLMKGVGTQMGFGNLMNFIVGCAYILPFALIFRKMTRGKQLDGKKRAAAVTVSGIAGLITVVIIGIGANYFIAPLFFKFFMNTEIGGDALWAAVWGATALNAVKGVILTIAAYPIVLLLSGKSAKLFDFH